MGKPKTKLKSLDAVEVSLVRRGANRKKFIRKGDDMDEMDKVIEVLEVKAEGEDNFLEAIAKSGKEISPEAKAAALAAMRTLNAFRDELPPDVLKHLGNAAGMKVEDPPKTDDTKVTKSDDTDDKKTDADKADKVEKEDDVPDDVKTKLEALWKSNEELKSQNEALVKKADETEAALKVERDLREEREFVAKAQKELGHLPGTAEEKGKLLKSLHDSGAKDVVDAVTKLLKSTNDVIADQGLFSEIGVGGMGSTGGNAWDKIQTEAKTLVAKSDDMTMEEAVDRVIGAQPDLYREYLAERN